MQKNFELLFTALALLTIELANEDVVIDLIRLSLALQVHTHSNQFSTMMYLNNFLSLLGYLFCNCFRDLIQDMALDNEENMPMFICCGIMALIAAYLNFLSQMIANSTFCQHVSKVHAPTHTHSCPHSYFTNYKVPVTH